MTTEKYGIENVKQAAEVAISFSFQLAKTIKGKFKIWDLLAFIDEFKGFAEVISKIKEVKLEFKDMSPAERAEVIQHVKDKFDLTDEKVEVFVENSLDWLDNTITMVEEAKSL